MPRGQGAIQANFLKEVVPWWVAGGGKDFHFSVSRLRRKALVLTSHIFTSTTAVVEERPREGKEGPLLDSGVFTQEMGPEVGLQWH